MILQQYKLVFAGSMGAGKSTAIQSISNINVLSTEAINTDTQTHQKHLTTVGIDYGELVLDDDIKVGLYGTPGQERFDFLWNVISQGAVGIILLIDHTATDPVSELDFYLSYFKEKSNNIVIGITHSDRLVQSDISHYHQWLSENNYNLPLFFVDARVKDDVLMLIDALLAKAEIDLTT